ncbi:YaiI/YqxD family protein [Marinobacter sp. 1Y8]
MPVWVDADACPVVIKEILCRAANRWKTDVTFVANQTVSVPPSAFIKTRQVPQGFDVADNEIVALLATGDLVVTQDIPLAADAIAKGADAISPRGEMFTPDNIRQRLAMRNFMEEIRNAGQMTGGPASFSQSDRKAFADKLDSWMQKHANQNQS